jgi:hypothetical protein
MWATCYVNRNLRCSEKSELTDATKNIAGINILAHETIRNVFALANRNLLGLETVTELVNFQFLLTDLHHFPDTKNHDLTGIRPRPDSRKCG